MEWTRIIPFMAQTTPTTATTTPVTTSFGSSACDCLVEDDEPSTSIPAYETSSGASSPLPLSSSKWRTSPFSESGAFINNTHVSSSIICLDFSTASTTINLNILVYPNGNSSTYPYSWYRLKVNDTVVADLYGNTAYTRQYSNSTPLTGNVGILSSPTNLIYDLSSYSGDSSVSISIESSCKSF